MTTKKTKAKAKKMTRAERIQRLKLGLAQTRSKQASALEEAESTLSDLECTLKPILSLDDLEDAIDDLDEKLSHLETLAQEMEALMLDQAEMEETLEKLEAKS